ncbi:unnamed protein product [Prorocentrum cordatum]|uniref:Uncharacterized protein n=1 Tax=Prorocentrum cordatum TaxID=2364126 RepID=A0ABN9VEV8_9DINO|nr:unnamed protein product [Polarella glacialis]
MGALWPASGPWAASVAIAWLTQCPACPEARVTCGSCPACPPSPAVTCGSCPGCLDCPTCSLACGAGPGWWGVGAALAAGLLLGFGGVGLLRAAVWFAARAAGLVTARAEGSSTVTLVVDDSEATDVPIGGVLVLDLSEHLVVALRRASAFHAKDIEALWVDARGLAIVMGVSAPAAPPGATAPRWIVSDPGSPDFGKELDLQMSGNPERLVYRDAVGIAMVSEEEGCVLVENVQEADEEDWRAEKGRGPGRDPRISPLSRRGPGHQAMLSDALGRKSSLEISDWTSHGPKALPELPFAVVAIGLTLTSYWGFWVSELGVSRNAGVSQEMRHLLNVLRHAVTFDLSDTSKLASFELVGRRVLQIQRAVKRCPRHLSLEGLDLMLRSSLDESGRVVTSKFDAFVAEEQRAQGVILKQGRLCREEQESDAKKYDSLGDDRRPPKLGPKAKAKPNGQGSGKDQAAGALSALVAARAGGRLDPRAACEQRPSTAQESVMKWVRRRVRGFGERPKDSTGALQELWKYRVLDRFDSDVARPVAAIPEEEDMVEPCFSALRLGLSVLGACRAFIGDGELAPVARLPPDVLGELAAAAGLVLLGAVDPCCVPSDVAFTTDSSPRGHAAREARLGPWEVLATTRLHPATSSTGRAAGFTDPSEPLPLRAPPKPRRAVAKRRRVGLEIGVPPEPLADALLDPGRWAERRGGAWWRPGRIPALEARAAFAPHWRAAADVAFHGKEILSLCGNLSSALAFEMGVATNSELPAQCRRAAAVRLGREIRWRPGIGVSQFEIFRLGSTTSYMVGIAEHAITGYPDVADATGFKGALEAMHFQEIPEAFLVKFFNHLWVLDSAPSGVWGRVAVYMEGPQKVLYHAGFLGIIMAPLRAAGVSQGLQGFDRLASALGVLFAGASHLTGALHERGSRVMAPMGYKFGPRCDLANRGVQLPVLHWLKSGELWWVHLGLPFTRRAPVGGGRGPLPADKTLVALSVRVIWLCRSLCVYVSFENPPASRAWRWPALERIAWPRVCPDAPRGAFGRATRDDLQVRAHALASPAGQAAARRRWIGFGPRGGLPLLLPRAPAVLLHRRDARRAGDRGRPARVTLQTRPLLRGVPAPAAASAAGATRRRAITCAWRACGLPRSSSYLRLASVSSCRPAVVELAEYAERQLLLDAPESSHETLNLYFEDLFFAGEPQRVGGMALCGHGALSNVVEVHTPDSTPPVIEIVGMLAGDQTIDVNVSLRDPGSAYPAEVSCGVTIDGTTPPDHEQYFIHRYWRMRLTEPAAASVRAALDLANATVAHSNLGAAGPDVASPPSLRFSGVGATYDGKKVDLVVEATSAYASEDTAFNGLSEGSMGSINLAECNSVDLTFTLLDADSGDPAAVGSFDVWFLDIDTEGVLAMAPTPDRLATGGPETATLPSHHNAGIDGVAVGIA